MHRRNIGISLIEINDEGMSELLDEEVNAQNEESENKNSGVYASPRKCLMKIKN